MSDAYRRHSRTSKSQIDPSMHVQQVLDRLALLACGSSASMSFLDALADLICFFIHWKIEDWEKVREFVYQLKPPRKGYALHLWLYRRALFGEIDLRSGFFVSAKSHFFFMSMFDPTRVCFALGDLKRACKTRVCQVMVIVSFACEMNRRLGNSQSAKVCLSLLKDMHMVSNEFRFFIPLGQLEEKMKNTKLPKVLQSGLAVPNYFNLAIAELRVMFARKMVFHLPGDPAHDELRIGLCERMRDIVSEFTEVLVLGHVNLSCFEAADFILEWKAAIESSSFAGAKFVLGFGLRILEAAPTLAPSMDFFIAQTKNNFGMANLEPIFINLGLQKSSAFLTAISSNVITMMEFLSAHFEDFDVMVKAQLPKWATKSNQKDAESKLIAVAALIQGLSAAPANCFDGGVDAVAALFGLCFTSMFDALVNPVSSDDQEIASHLQLAARDFMQAQNKVVPSNSTAASSSSAPAVQKSNDLSSWKREADDNVISGAGTVTVGKHKGRTFDDVMKNEPSYCEWIMKSELTGNLNELQKYIASATGVASNIAAPSPAKKAASQGNNVTSFVPSAAESKVSVFPAGIPAMMAENLVPPPPAVAAAASLSAPAAQASKDTSSGPVAKNKKVSTPATASHVAAKAEKLVPAPPAVAAAASPSASAAQASKETSSASVSASELSKSSETVKKNMQNTRLESEVASDATSTASLSAPLVEQGKAAPVGRAVKAVKKAPSEVKIVPRDVSRFDGTAAAAAAALEAAKAEKKAVPGTMVSPAAATGPTSDVDPPKSVKVAKVCIVCSNASKFLCPCREVRYCSEKCQKAHWKSHKKTCKKK